MPTDTERSGAKLYRWDDIPLEQLNPLFTRRLVTGSQAMVASIQLLKGCVVPLHHHHNEQLSMCLSGSMEFVLDGHTVTIRAGEILVIPSNIPHSAFALEDFNGLDIFSPPPGDRDVISQARRDSSSETKIAPRSVRIAACAGRGASSGIIASRAGASATSLSRSTGC